MYKKWYSDSADWDSKMKFSYSNWENKTYEKNQNWENKTLYSDSSNFYYYPNIEQDKPEIKNNKIIEIIEKMLCSLEHCIDIEKFREIYNSLMMLKYYYSFTDNSYSFDPIVKKDEKIKTDEKIKLEEDLFEL